MSLEDKDKLQEEMNEKVRQEMAGHENLYSFLQFTLGNFAYRYFPTDQVIEDLPVLIDVKNGSGNISVSEECGNLKEALKTENQETRSGLISLAQKFPLKDKPKAVYEINIEVVKLNSQGGGQFNISATVNWDYPNFSKKNQTMKNTRTKKLTYQDIIELRNHLARELDEVCSVL